VGISINLKILDSLLLATSEIHEIMPWLPQLQKAETAIGLDCCQVVAAEMHMCKLQQHVMPLLLYQPVLQFLAS